MIAPRKWLIATSIALVVAILVESGHCQAEESPTATDTSALPEAARLIDFAHDVQPIFASKCQRCHGPDEAKNDFRIDEAESVLSYTEPGDATASSLWTDYLVTDDEETRMPPASDKPEEKLTGIELATIKLWIEEGALWPAASEVPTDSQPSETPMAASLVARIWEFQGLFHPATTHFPIALLTVSAGFVLLSFFRSQTCEPVAFHCLWIGALGAIVAALAGWSYAAHEGYGAGFTFDLSESAIDRHRWLGVAVAVLAVILVPMASYVRRTQDMGMRFMWLLGSVLLLGAVGTVGYQGGELTYGEGHYEEEFQRLFPEVARGQAEAALEELPKLEGQDSTENQVVTEEAEVLIELDASDDAEGDKSSAESSEKTSPEDPTSAATAPE